MPKTHNPVWCLIWIGMYSKQHDIDLQVCLICDIMVMLYYLRVDNSNTNGREPYVTLFQRRNEILTHKQNLEYLCQYEAFTSNGY